ncbi:MAG TPA: PIN domain-containing protein [Longimicrobium sp.]|nr:PIN domain-containing protein [Longimicrobium sp.]
MTWADRVVAVYDANILYPAPLRDLLVRLARAGLVAARWTDHIHDEWMRSVLKNRPDLSPANLQRTRELMEMAVPGALVEGYEAKIPGLHLPDPDDRHVLAAAIEAKADVIVTFNLGDFPASVVSEHGVEVMHPDDFVMELIARYPAGVVQEARTHRAALRKPALSPDEYLENLARIGLRSTAGWLRNRAEEI